MIYLRHHGKPNDYNIMNYHQLNSNINGSIRGNNYELVSIDVNTQYKLTVTDIKGDDVISIQQLHVHFFMVRRTKKYFCGNYYSYDQCF